MLMLAKMLADGRRKLTISHFSLINENLFIEK